MTSLLCAARPSCELLERRVQFSGATELAHFPLDFADGRQAVVGVSNGDKAIFAGGLVQSGTGSGDTDAVTIYDVVTGQTTDTHLPTQHFLNVAVTVGDKSVLVGGYSLVGGETAEVDVYDGRTGLFTTYQLPKLKLYRVATKADGKAILAGNNVAATRFADTFDPVTGQWGAIELPRPVSGVAAAVSCGNFTLIASSTGANLFDSVTGRWTGINAPLRGEDRFLHAASAGSKAVLIDDAGHVAVFDFATRRWTTSQRRSLAAISAAAAGNKLIFAGGAPTNAPAFVDSAVDYVDVYDVRTGTWSSTSLSGPSAEFASVSVGRSAVFAFGSFAGLSLGAAQIFTDAAPAPLFTGSLSGRAGHTANLTLFNTGDADLTGPYTVEMYASTDRTLRGAIRIGRLGVNVPLAAGASTLLQIRTAPPRLPRGGTFYLLAAVRDGQGRLTPVAASEAAFRVKPSGAGWG